MAAAIGKIYNDAFHRSPAGTLAVTNGFLSGVADVVAQGTQMGLAYRERANQKPSSNPYLPPPAEILIPSYDPIRTARFVAFGVFMGPILARWNHWLEHTFPLRPAAASSASGATSAASKAAADGVASNVQKAVQSTSGPPGKVSLTALAKRVGMDQVVMAPFGLAVFLGSMGVMEGHSLPAIQKKYVDLYPPAIKANWTVWPLIQFVNFRFMPLPARVPFQATCGVFWTLYLSLLNSSGATKVEAARKDLDHAEDQMKDIAKGK